MWIERDGKSVESATEAVLEALRLPLTDVDLEVLAAGTRGLFGLGGEPAVVRGRAKSKAPDVRSAFEIPKAFDSPLAGNGVSVLDQPQDEDPEDWQDEALPQAKSDPSDQPPPISQDGVDDNRPMTVAVEIVQGIVDRMGVTVDVSTRTHKDTLYVELTGPEVGILIGRAGATLGAIQDLVRAGVQRQVGQRIQIVVDAERYWSRNHSKS